MMSDKGDCLRSPIKWYGGKARIVDKILKIVPEHDAYIEPYCGGASLLFAKEAAGTETINDIDEMLINFYQVIKYDFAEFERKIKSTLHSRADFNRAIDIYKNSHMISNVDKAWAVWVKSVMSFGASGHSFGFTKNDNGNFSKSIINRRNHICDMFSRRLENVQIECDDAIPTIKRYDCENALHYIDPPYIKTDCSAYNTTYSNEKYLMLLEILSKISGKFILSSYDNFLVNEAIKKNKWNVKKIETHMCVSGKIEAREKREELLITNFRIKEQEKLFTI